MRFFEKIGAACRREFSSTAACAVAAAAFGPDVGPLAGAFMLSGAMAAAAGAAGVPAAGRDAGAGAPEPVMA